MALRHSTYREHSLAPPSRERFPILAVLTGLRAHARSSSFASRRFRKMGFEPWIRDPAVKSDGQALVYNAATGQWIAADLTSIGSGTAAADEVLTANGVGNTSFVPIGTPVIRFISQVLNSGSGIADSVAVNLGVPTNMRIGDIAIAVMSTLSTALTGTISASTGAAGWAAVDGASHDTSYVWRIFAKQITGLAEPANWDQFTVTGLGVATWRYNGAILVFRNANSGATTRSTVKVSRTADLNPLVSDDLTTYARPGDLLFHVVNSKNGVGGINPPTGYIEVIDAVNGALWTYLSYKIAAGTQAGTEKNASVAITPGNVADHNDVSLTAFQHYGGA
jgi:hypothetical protein